MYCTYYFRFGHTTIPAGILRRNRECEFKPTRTGGKALRLCATWWDAQVRTAGQGQSGCHVVLAYAHLDP